MLQTLFQAFRKRGVLTAAAMIPLAACAGDETLSAYGAAGKTWVLSEMNGKAYVATATLEFPKPGQIAGQGPCNAYRAELSAPYPWFEAKNLAATRAVCPDLLEETRYLEALQSMTEAEVTGDVLILRNEAGGELLFSADG